ncbi:hypothetical protein [Actinomadura sp. 3N407]|uniref:hypothetical protein n=1 Tax=Actinomadura sp. 3N407 TaxID=3457423 RepID=UPI003FCE03F7
MARPHLIISGSAQDVPYRHSDAQARDGRTRTHRIHDRMSHARLLTQNLMEARDRARETALPTQGPIPRGFTVCVEGWTDEPSAPLALEHLDANGAKLLSARDPGMHESLELAVVWMPYGAETTLLDTFTQFARDDAGGDHLRHEALVANIKRIRAASLRDFWQELTPFPGHPGKRWWEVWFATAGPHGNPALEVEAATQALGMRMSAGTLTLQDRTVAMIYATAEQLAQLLRTDAIVAEVHRPASPQPN